MYTIQQPSSTRVAEQYHRPYTNLLKETEVDKLEVEDLEEPATAGRYEYQFAAAPVRPGWSFLKSVGTRPWFQRQLPNTSDTLGFKDLYKERLEDKVNPLHHPFVCLHERLGAANDICHDLYQLEALHEALIHNPKTGIPLAELLSALLEDPLTGVETAKARYQAKKQGHHNFESYEKQYLLAASVPRATATIRKVDELLQKAKLEEVGMGLAVFNLVNSIRATQENDGRSASHKAVAIGAASFAVTHSLASGAGASVAGTVLLAIWPILVLAALTIFFAWLTASTAYSPQVLFYANYLFNLDGLKDLKLNYAELTCEALMAEIESNKNEIISRTFAHFRDFDAAIREFESLYPMLVITAKSEDQQKSLLVYDGKRGADKQFENRVEYIRFEGQFLQFSSSMAVEYGLLSVGPDKHRGNGVGVFFTGYEKVEFYENSFQFLIGYDLRSVPEERFYDEAWFFIRLILNEGQEQYWPITANNQQARYYVVKARLKESGEVKADLNDLYKTSVGKEYIDLSTDFLNRGNTLEAFEDYQKRKTLTIWSVDEFMAETGLQPGRISTIKRSNDEVNPETERFITNFFKSK